MRIANSTAFPQKILIWFVYSTILTTAFTTLTSKAVADDKIQSSTNVSSLSVLQLKKLNAACGLHGLTLEVGSDVSSNTLAILKITQSELVQINIEEEKNKTHAYSSLQDGTMLFSFITKSAYNYHVDKNFKLIASVAMTDKIPSNIPNAEASLKAELTYWANIADQLDDSGH